MKKLMIALAAVAMATCTQAANWKWKTNATAQLGPVYAIGGTSLADGLKAYIFADGMQDTVFNAWYNNGGYDGTMASGSLDNQIINSGVIAAKADSDIFVTPTTGSKQYFFFAVIDADKNLYISSTANGSESSLASGKTLQFAEVATSKADPKTGATAFSSAGWYSAVPEPTSGLLLLLGVAGLALRRRRA